MPEAVIAAPYIGYWLIFHRFFSLVLTLPMMCVYLKLPDDAHIQDEFPLRRKIRSPYLFLAIDIPPLIRKSGKASSITSPIISQLALPHHPSHFGLLSMDRGGGGKGVSFIIQNSIKNREATLFYYAPFLILFRCLLYYPIRSRIQWGRRNLIRR